MLLQRLEVKSVEVFEPNEHSQWTGPPSSADLIYLSKRKPVGYMRFKPGPLDPEANALPLHYIGSAVSAGTHGIVLMIMKILYRGTYPSQQFL